MRLCYIASNLCGDFENKFTFFFHQFCTSFLAIFTCFKNYTIISELSDIESKIILRNNFEKLVDKKKLVQKCLLYF